MNLTFVYRKMLLDHLKGKARIAAAWFVVGTGETDPDKLHEAFMENITF